MSANPWWSNTGQSKPAPESPPPKKEGRPAPASERPSRAVNEGSIGEQIDQAVAEFEARLAELRETLDQRRSEISGIQREIEKVEKQQAEALKGLLSDNPLIKRMLTPKSKRRIRRRRAATTSKAGQRVEPDSPDVDTEAPR